MLKLLMGLVYPESGTVKVKGKPVRNMSKEELGHTMSLVYQNPEEMFIKDSIRKDIEYAMKVRKIENYIDKVEILNDLDVKASDLLQSNGIIWVEGPSDRVYIKKWLEIICSNKYVEGIDYQFMYYGGRLLSHYSTEQEEDLISILLTNRNAAIVMDSDKRNRHSKINSTKQRIIREFEDHGMFAWVTKGKEIENYLSARAINKCFSSELDECGQYAEFDRYISGIFPSFSSRKNDFAKMISGRLTKEDIAGSLDLEEQIKELYKHIERWNQ